MNPRTKMLISGLRRLLGMICVIALVPGDVFAEMPLAPPTQESAAQDQTAKIPADQLDSLVAPIALFPDPMLAQVLAASTYPLEIIQLQQWLTKNPKLKGKDLADAVAKQPWDPSVQAWPERLTWLSAWQMISSGLPTSATHFWRSKMT